MIYTNQIISLFILEDSGEILQIERLYQTGQETFPQILLKRDICKI